MDRYVSNRIVCFYCNFWLKILEHGDCGSWVIDPDHATLYGYITAGDPGTSIAYVIPAHQAFHNIDKTMSSNITFPSLENSIDRRGILRHGGTTWEVDSLDELGTASLGGLLGDTLKYLNKDAVRIYRERSSSSEWVVQFIRKWPAVLLQQLIKLKADTVSQSMASEPEDEHELRRAKRESSTRPLRLQFITFVKLQKSPLASRRPLGA